MTITSRVRLAQLGALAALAVSPTAGAETTCHRTGTIDTNGGAYYVQNNFWNNNAPGNQCVDVNTGTGSFTVTGSSWVVSNGPPSGYPSIVKGCHWGKCTANSGMPVKLSELKSARTRWSVTPAGPGQWNISYDAWFNKAATTDGQPDGTEIMVWINRSGTVTPAGTRVGNVNINGMNWEVWTAPRGSAHFNTIWHIVSYVAVNPTNYVDFDLKPFFDDASNRGLLDRDWHLIDVEAGTEIWQSGYGMRSNSFEVTVEKGSGPGPDPVPIDPNRWYAVVNQNSGACVDDAEFGTWNGAKLQQWSCNTNGAANQRWKFVPTDSGYVKVITQQAQNLAWDVAEWGTSNGSKLHLWSYGGGHNQQWKAEAVGGGKYRFVGRASGKCLDVPGASTANGVQLQIYDCNGTPAQSFQLIER